MTHSPYDQCDNQYKSYTSNIIQSIQIIYKQRHTINTNIREMASIYKQRHTINTNIRELAIIRNQRNTDIYIKFSILEVQIHVGSFNDFSFKEQSDVDILGSPPISAYNLQHSVETSQ